MSLLIISFFITAILYAAVGFGGGSTYNALLALSGTDYRILPTIALISNIIVVTGGVWRFHRADLIRPRRAFPFIVTSVPAAIIGGWLSISEVFFLGLLGTALLTSSLPLFLTPRRLSDHHDITDWRNSSNGPHPITMPVIGAVLGIVAGTVGIGGGIFLAPILYLTRWGSAREIAATCSLFILINSLSGLAGQFLKLGSFSHSIAPYWPLFLAVFVGGQIGSRLAATRLPETAIRRFTGILMAYVAIRLLLRWWELVFSAG